MQNDFAGWYSSLSLTDDANYIANRQRAIVEFAKGANANELELLTQIAFRLKASAGSPEIAGLRGKLTGDQPTLGDEEFVLLAAATLALVMEEDSDSAALAATAVSTTYCAGLRPLRQPMDLVGSSDNVLRRMAETSRRRPELKAENSPTSAFAENEVAAIVATAAAGSVAAAIQELAQSTNKILNELSLRQATFESAAQKYVLVQDEELDILWWLLGEHSNDLDLSFNEVPLKQRPLVIARELARMTTVLPGPSAIRSLFARAGIQDGDSCSITESIEGMPAKWLAEIPGEFPMGNSAQVTRPILFAIMRHQELDGNDGWIQAWSMLTGIDKAARLSPLQLAEAAYREFILNKFR